MSRRIREAGYGSKKDSVSAVGAWTQVRSLWDGDADADRRMEEREEALCPIRIAPQRQLVDSSRARSAPRHGDTTTLCKSPSLCMFPFARERVAVMTSTGTATGTRRVFVGEEGLTVEI
jgi:hypothetical protein